MNSKRKILIASGLVAAVAASGGAFTAGLTVNDATDVAAAGETSVTGATVNSIDYNYAADGLASVTVVFAGEAAAATEFDIWLLDGTGATVSGGTDNVTGANDATADNATTVTFTFATAVDDSTVANTRIAVNGDLTVTP